MVIGLQKVGKTTLGLSALSEGPLAMLDYDFGTEGVITNFDQKRIWHLALDAPTSMLHDDLVTAEAYKMAWIKAKGAYYAALTDPRIKTVMIDTASEFREAQILSFFGKLDKIMPHRYGEPNGEMRKLLRDAYDRPDLNLVLIHKVKDEYINDVRTGRTVFSGFKDTPGLAQMVVTMWKRDNGEYGLTIVDCRHKRSLEGRELPAAVANFEMLLSLAHGPKVAA